METLVEEPLFNLFTTGLTMNHFSISELRHEDFEESVANRGVPLARIHVLKDVETNKKF